MKTLLWVLLPALCHPIAVPAAENVVETIAPGLKHITIRRGEVAAGTRYRVLVGTYTRQSEADRTLDRLRAIGVDAVPTADGTSYRVVTPAFSSHEEAEALRVRLVERGFTSPLEIQETEKDLTHTGGPWSIHVLEVDPGQIEVEVVHAYDAAIGLETTAALAVRHAATAAINGGYFRMKGLLAGDSRGILQIDGRLLSEPDRGRAGVGFYEHEGDVRAVFGRLSFRGETRLAEGDPIPLDGINRQRGSSEIVLFTPEFHRTTLTSPKGSEIVIENGQVTGVLVGKGSSVIPANGMVISVGSERHHEVVPRMRQGANVSVSANLLPLLPDPEGEWDKAEDIIGGGPLLLWKGRRLEEPEKESISRVFFLARHPRTAVGARADGTLLFVTVDGRRPAESVGMSLPELTDLLLELGCVSAINLDGGGSTTMVINGEVVNRPSSFSGPRANADAILLFPKKQ